MTEKVKILFVDDEDYVLSAVQRAFLDDSYEILTANSAEKGLALLAVDPPVHVVVSDYRMPGMDGIEFLRTVARRWPDTVRIMLSGQADTTVLVSVINEGYIYKFILKPWNDDELRIAVANAATLFFLERRVRELMQELKSKDEEIIRLQALCKQRPDSGEGKSNEY